MYILIASASDTLINPLGSQFSSISGFVQGVLGVAMYVGIPFIGLVLVYAGFKFLSARGKAEGISDAIYHIKWVFLGIAVFLGAWALTKVIDSTIKSIMSGQ